MAQDAAAAHDLLRVRMWIKLFRVRNSIKQKELAKAVGVTPSAMSQIELGTKTPSLNTLVKIAKQLNVATSDLFKEIPEPLNP